KKYFSVMEDSWMEDRPGRKGWVWRSLKQKAISISPQAAAQGEKLLLEALQQTRNPLEKKRINVILSGLRYAKFAIDENDLASKIAKAPLKNNQDALAMQQQIMQFGQLIQQRQKFWGDATRSDDLFGASIKNTPLLHNNISALELPIIHDMI